MPPDPPDPADTKLIELLERRDGLLTTVRLRDGSQHVVKDIAWGYDLDDEPAHITTNVSPGGGGFSVDFFYSDAVVGLSDTASGEVITLRSPLMPIPARGVCLVDRAVPGGRVVHRLGRQRC